VNFRGKRIEGWLLSGGLKVAFLGFFGQSTKSVVFIFSAKTLKSSTLLRVKN